jgi:hypothetical protein
LTVTHGLSEGRGAVKSGAQREGARGRKLEHGAG